MKIFTKISILLIIFILNSSKIWAVTQPSIQAPSTIDKGNTADIKIVLGSEQSSYYNILFEKAGANGTNIPLTAYIILCDPDSEPQPCELQESPSNPSGVTGNPTYGEDPDLGQTVNIPIDTNNADVTVGTYKITIKPQTSSPIGNDFTPQTVSLVVNDSSAPNLQPKIIKIGNTGVPPADPTNIDIKTTANLSLAIQLQNKVSGQYLLQPVGFNFANGSVINCPGGNPDCGTTVRLTDRGLAPGTYNVNVNESAGSKTLGRLSFVIVGDPKDQPKGGIFLPTTCKSRSDPTFNQGVDIECSRAAGQTCTINNSNRANEPGILTAIGCIPTEPQSFINRFIRFAAFGGGGIALLLMIFGAIQMVASAGNPETLKKGQETFTAAIIGLLFIIFSTLLLQIIGVDILSLPGFGR